MENTNNKPEKEPYNVICTGISIIVGLVVMEVSKAFLIKNGDDDKPLNEIKSVVNDSPILKSAVNNPQLDEISSEIIHQCIPK